MKTVLTAIIVLFCARTIFGQGEINFNNRANASGTPGESPGVVIAPVYNVDPACPFCGKTGNTGFGSPQGFQSYNGSVLAGTNYIVTLWALNSRDVVGDILYNNLQLVGQTTMRTNTTGIHAGQFALPSANPIIPDVQPASADRATFQVRIWDSKNGTVSTWEQAIPDFTVARGLSGLFTVPYALTSGVNPPPNLEGLQSFQLFLLIPEPSVFALTIMILGCLLVSRRSLP